MSNAVRMEETDNVVTATSLLHAGDVLSVGGKKVKVREEIPFGHKVALKRMSTGEDVIKYGLQIGSMKRDVEEGGHVHIHNVESNYGRGDR